MDTALFQDHHKQSFTDNGFCIVENAFNDKLPEIKTIIHELAEWEKKDGRAHVYDDEGHVQRIWNLLNKHEIFSELVTCPLIMAAMAWIFDRETPHFKYYLSSFQASVNSPGALLQKLHVDTPVPEPLPPWVIKANSIWLLDDFTDRNGATEVLPGSHLSPLKPRSEDFGNPDIIKVIAPAGSILFTHGAVWHRAGANQSDADRAVLFASFAASFAREIAAEEDQVKTLDQSILDNASDELKQVLGSDHGVRPGGDIPSPF